MLKNHDWNITLTANDILRAQDSDPVVIQQRRPALVEVAEWAAHEAQTLIQPFVLIEGFRIKELRHERLLLQPLLSTKQEDHPEAIQSGYFLSGSLLASQLGTAEEVHVVLCTIGKQLEQYASQVISDDLLRGLALDAAGSAAAEILGETVCRHFEAEAAEQGKCVSIPYGPGMIGWSVEVGQPQIFHLLEYTKDKNEANQITLNKDYIMTPRKSVSFVLGWGAKLAQQNRTCDFCGLKKTCRYQDAYAR
jgi:hypothetical protein